MTVPGELAQWYNHWDSALRQLKERADFLLTAVAKSVGGQFRSSRIKPIESLLAKIEKDGPAQPLADITDLYAAMITVPNARVIAEVKSRIEESFVVVEDVPPKSKAPDAFVYDDRHFILQLLPDEGRNQEALEGIRFELQVKTEMQAAAWAITHLLSYKTRWQSWDRARLASRIRATVEMIDDLLVKLMEAADDLEQPPAESYELFQKRNEIVAILERNLAPEQLPTDRRRLGVTVETYMSTCKPNVTPGELETYLQKQEYVSICQAVSLSAAGSVFIILVAEGKLGPTPESLRGDRRFLVTQGMIDLYPALTKVPSERRVDLSVYHVPAD